MRPPGAARGRKITVLSMEQALTLPYATQRMSRLGWRVIRLEPAPRPGQARPGDPNRYVGKNLGYPDRFSYFFSANVGKEAIALNLKDPEGQSVLKTLIDRLEVDVFACNVLPMRYRELGISYEELSGISRELIWLGISAKGPEFETCPGYDPAVQALTGYMELTGDPEGAPMLCGIPIVDLKAGDDAYAETVLAMWQRELTGQGRRIDISLARSALSWLGTALPLLDLGHTSQELTRTGNEHRLFVPTGCFPASDGHMYLAIGNDRQWEILVSLPEFASLKCDAWVSNQGRAADRKALKQRIAAITAKLTMETLADLLAGAKLVHSPVNTLDKVQGSPLVKKHGLTTTTPDGRKVRLEPPCADTYTLREEANHRACAPAYGEHTEAVLTEAGFSRDDIASFQSQGLIACHPFR